MCKTHGDGSVGIVVTVPTDAVGIPILRGAAEEGFPGINVPYMMRMIRFLEFDPSPFPQTEHDCVKVLLKGCPPLGAQRRNCWRLWAVAT